MPKLFSRAAVAGAAFQQARKFLASPKGKQMVAQARTRAQDPATRAKVNEFVGKVRGGGKTPPPTSR